MAEPWGQNKLDGVQGKALSNVKLAFDIVPDPQDPRSPLELMQQLKSALQNANSLLRSGPSGFMLDGASLELDNASTSVRIPPASQGSVLRDDFPRGPPNSRVSGQFFPSEAVATGGPPALPSELQSVPPPALIEVKDTTEELLLKNTDLLKSIDDMKSENEKLVVEKGEVLGKLAKSDDLLVEKLKEIDAIQQALDNANKNCRYLTEQLEDTKRNLAQAKEMWMKESARATKLREQLDAAENTIADKDKEIAKIGAILKKNETENSNLKHILSRSTAVLTSPQVEKFAPSDSYFHTRARVGITTPPPVMYAGNSPTAANITSASLNNPLFTGNAVNGKQPLTATSVSCSKFSHLVGSPASSCSSKFLTLCLSNDGVLFEDEIIQIGVKAKYSGLGEGVLGIYYGNKTSGILQNFQTRYSPESSALFLTTSPVPSQLGPRNQICQRVSAQITGPFDVTPKLTVSFLLPDNTPKIIPLRLPVTIGKFMQGRDLSVEEFFSNWRIQQFLLNEASCVVNVVLNLAQIARIASLGGALSLHHQVDEVPDNIVLVGQFPSDSADGIRCATIPEALVLVRIEVGTASDTGKARIAVRSNDPTVANGVKECLAQQISAP